MAAVVPAQQRSVAAAPAAAAEAKERSEALAHMHLTRILRSYILQMISGGWAAAAWRLGSQQTWWLFQLC